jgi:hypothetical protein
VEDVVGFCYVLLHCVAYTATTATHGISRGRVVFVNIRWAEFFWIDAVVYAELFFSNFPLAHAHVQADPSRSSHFPASSGGLVVQ